MFNFGKRLKQIREEKVIFLSHADHNAKLATAEGKVNAEIEYADTLLRNYHKMIGSKI